MVIRNWCMRYNFEAPLRFSINRVLYIALQTFIHKETMFEVLLRINKINKVLLQKQVVMPVFNLFSVLILIGISLVGNCLNELMVKILPLFQFWICLQIEDNGTHFEDLEMNLVSGMFLTYLISCEGLQVEKWFLFNKKDVRVQEIIKVWILVYVQDLPLDHLIWQ